MPSTAGGQLGFTHARRGENRTTTVSIGPAVTYYFVRPGAPHPYLRGSASQARATGSMSSEAVGLDAQLFAGRIDSDQGSSATSVFGLRFGISAFVF